MVDGISSGNGRTSILSRCCWLHLSKDHQNVSFRKSKGQFWSSYFLSLSFFFLMCSCLQLFNDCIFVNSKEKLVSINASWRGASFCLIKQLRTHTGNDIITEHFNSTPWLLANSFCGQPIFHQSGKSCNILATAEWSAIHTILQYDDLYFRFLLLKK